MKYKFIGGPWDGESHETDGRDSVDIAYPCLTLRQLAESVEVDMINPIETCRYSLRVFKSFDNDRQISFYAESQWSDMCIFSRLLCHYQGTL